MTLETLCREYRLPLQVTLSHHGWVATIRGAETIADGVRSSVLGAGATPQAAMHDLAAHLGGAQLYLGLGAMPIPMPTFAP